MAGTQRNSRYSWNSKEQQKHNRTARNIRNSSNSKEQLEQKLQRNFLQLYGFMLLSGSIESDNHNGAIEKFEKHTDK